jgi:hypothetical protein
MDAFVNVDHVTLSSIAFDQLQVKEFAYRNETVRVFGSQRNVSTVLFDLEFGESVSQLCFPTPNASLGCSRIKERNIQQEHTANYSYEHL